MSPRRSLIVHKSLIQIDWLTMYCSLRVIPDGTHLSTLLEWQLAKGADFSRFLNWVSRFYA